MSPFPAGLDDRTAGRLTRILAPGSVRQSSHRGGMAKLPVLIVGAGPTGLALALWLNRLGVAVRIIDRTAEPGTTSRALAVQARTLELYGQLGLADAVVDAGVKVENG